MKAFFDKLFGTKARFAEMPAGSPELEKLWSQLVPATTRTSRFAGAYLINAHPVSFAKGVFTIGFDSEFEDQLALVDTPKNHTLVRTKLAELGHPNAQIKFIKAKSPSAQHYADTIDLIERSRLRSG